MPISARGICNSVPKHKRTIVGWARSCAHADTKPRGQTKTLSAHPYKIERIHAAELLVVMVIVGDHARHGVLQSDAGRASGIANDAQRIALLLQLARDEAIVRNRPIAFERRLTDIASCCVTEKPGKSSSRMRCCVNVNSNASGHLVDEPAFTRANNCFAHRVRAASRSALPLS